MIVDITKLSRPGQFWDLDCKFSHLPWVTLSEDLHGLPHLKHFGMTFFIYYLLFWSIIYLPRMFRVREYACYFQWFLRMGYTKSSWNRRRFSTCDGQWCCRIQMTTARVNWRQINDAYNHRKSCCVIYKYTCNRAFTNSYDMWQRG